MRKLLIAAPWITASGAALYTVSQWSSLPARMAVTFYAGRVSGWQAKATAIPVFFLLMFGILTLFTVLLSMPGKIHVREGVLSDPVADRRRLMHILLAAHLAFGVWAPLSVVHIVNRNL